MSRRMGSLYGSWYGVPRPTQDHGSCGRMRPARAGTHVRALAGAGERHAQHQQCALRGHGGTAGNKLHGVAGALQRLPNDGASVATAATV